MGILLGILLSCKIHELLLMSFPDCLWTVAYLETILTESQYSSFLCFSLLPEIYKQDSTLIPLDDTDVSYAVHRIDQYSFM
jgi:hypothetical protein